MNFKNPRDYLLVATGLFAGLSIAGWVTGNIAVGILCFVFAVMAGLTID